MFDDAYMIDQTNQLLSNGQKCRKIEAFLPWKFNEQFSRARGFQIG